jgi:hypothetical protein
MSVERRRQETAVKPFKDLTQAGLVARAFMVFPLAAVGIGLLGYGDTHGIVWMLPVGGVLFAIAFVVIGLCAFHGFNGPLSFGRPMPPRRDGTRGTPEEDDAEREEIRERLRQTQRRGLTVFPLALAGVVLGILGEELPNETMSTLAPYVFGAGFVLLAAATLSGMIPLMRHLWRR